MWMGQLWGPNCVPSYQGEWNWLPVSCNPAETSFNVFNIPSMFACFYIYIYKHKHGWDIKYIYNIYILYIYININMYM